MIKNFTIGMHQNQPCNCMPAASYNVATQWCWQRDSACRAHLCNTAAHSSPLLAPCRESQRRAWCRLGPLSLSLHRQDIEAHNEPFSVGGACRKTHTRNEVCKVKPSREASSYRALHLHTETLSASCLCPAGHFTAV